MTKAEFLELLKKYNINENLVVFDDAIKEGYCVRKNYFRWEVFFRERGKEYDCVGFPSESNALQYLFDKLYSLYVKRNTGRTQGTVLCVDKLSGL